MRLRAAVPIVLLLQACGGGPPLPTAPAAPAPPPGVPTGTVLSVLSGETGMPVSGAKVVVAGRTYTTGADGHVTLGERADLGSLLDVVATGFLDRQTLLRSASDTEFALWPSRTATGLDEDFTRQIIYTSSDVSTEGGDKPLDRLPTGTRVALVPAPEIRGDRAAFSVLDDGAALMTDAAGGKASYQVVDAAPAGTLAAVLKVDAQDPLFVKDPQAVAFARIQTNNRDEIVALTIVFQDLKWARRPNITNHELGHTLGLEHSPHREDLMNCCSATPTVFTPRERIVIDLAYQRRPGNAFPDNDRASTAQGRGRTRVIVCGSR